MLPLLLACLALVAAVAALALGWVVLRSQRTITAQYLALWGDGAHDAVDLSESVGVLARRTTALERRAEAADAEIATAQGRLEQTLQHVAVVRYDAFGDLGGRLSFSVALVDDRGDGVVISSIHSRGESRTYAKGVVQDAGEVVLTPEEQQALDAARGRA